MFATTLRTSSAASRRLLIAGGALALLAGALAPAAALAPGFEKYTKAGFEAALKGAKPVIVHVHADWCPVCRKQEAVFNELSGTPDLAKYKGIVVNFDADTDFRSTYKVNNQSVLLVFKGGKEVARSGGETDKAKIAAFIASSAK